MFDFSEGVYSGLSTPAGSLSFPETVTYDDARGFMWGGTGAAHLMLGQDGEGDAIGVDFTADSPHVLISAASGAGKSVTARALVTQALCKGWHVVILDAKRHSHRWAKNLPHVHYASTFPEIGNALVSVGMEMHRRNEVVEEWPGSIESAPVGPRVMVLFEEMNATMSQLEALGRKLPKGQYTATDAFADIMFLGRAAQVHVVGVAQFADVKAMGGSAIRENFGTRVLIRYTKQAWTMLAYDCGVPQPAPDARGRGMVCRGGKARQTQLLYLSEEECAELARSSIDASDALSRRQLRRQARDAQAALGRATGLS